MSKKISDREFPLTMFIIIIYLVSNSWCMQKFGLTSLNTFLVNLVLTLMLVIFIVKNKLLSYYGLNKVPKMKKYLYFIPLFLIASLNFINGININNTVLEIIYHIINMCLIGFLEELVFRGFLFKMMSKDNVRSAIIVSSLTFGIGHIINLLNGASLVPTLIQVIYATAVGYLFVLIFYKSKSLWPPIITHVIVNATSIFGIENNLSMYITPLILIVISVSYALYIKKLKED